MLTTEIVFFQPPRQTAMMSLWTTFGSSFSSGTTASLSVMSCASRYGRIHRHAGSSAQSLAPSRSYTIGTGGSGRCPRQKVFCLGLLDNDIVVICWAVPLSESDHGFGTPLQNCSNRKWRWSSAGTAASLDVFHVERAEIPSHHWRKLSLSMNQECFALRRARMTSSSNDAPYCAKFFTGTL